MRDAIVVGQLLLGFATFATAHVALSAWLLFFSAPRWRGAAALVVPPLAPYWGWREGRRRTVVLWTVALCVYLSGLLLAKLG